MAALGKKVLLADFDPQCNLTGMVMGFKGIADLESTYCASPPNNVKDGLAPAFEAQPKAITGVECVPVAGCAGLYLMQGHVALSEYENSLGIAQELSGSLLPLKNLPGAIRFLIERTAKECAVDYVLVDMSPSLGPLNQNLLTTSDFFVVPLQPDYFSSMALSSLARILPRWQAWAKMAHGIDTLKSADYPFPAPNAKFIGAIIQRYRPRNGGASSAFQHWIDKLKNGLENTLVPALKGAGLLDCKRFADAELNPTVPIMEVSDFNSLIALSQEFQVPVFEVTKEQTGQTGAVWQQTEKSKESFRASFHQCAERIFNLTGNHGPDVDLS